MINVLLCPMAQATAIRAALPRRLNLKEKAAKCRGKDLSMPNYSSPFVWKFTSSHWQLPAGTSTYRLSKQSNPKRLALRNAPLK